MHTRVRAVCSRAVGIALFGAVLLGNCGMAFGATTSETGDWPGFRGPRATGVSDAMGVFGAGGTKLEVAWKRPLGKGYSGIAVAENRVVTIYSDGTSDVVLALDPTDGSERWRYRLDDTYRGHDGSQDGPISTPAIWSGHVFVIAPRGKLVALRVEDGARQWECDLVADFGATKPHWGFGTSPLVESGVLIVALGAKDATVCGFEPATGKRLWSAGKDGISYQSPVPFVQDSRPRVLVAGNTKLLCVDPQTGAVDWEYSHEGGGEYGATCLVPVPLDNRHVLLKHTDEKSMVLEITGEGAQREFRTTWAEPSLAKSYSVAVHHDGHIFGYNGRTATCVAASTGKPSWRARQPGDGFPIVVDGHLIFMTKEGGLHVVRATPESYQETAGLKLFSDLVWSPPSFAQGSVFARSFGELARVNIARSAAPIAAREAAAPDISGTAFAKFLDRLRGSTDKSAAIDAFLTGVRQFPMIEPDGRVVFVYRGPGNDLAIGGDLTGFGNKLRMQRVDGTDLFYSVARLEPDAHITYAFVRDFHAIPDPRNPRKTMVAGLDDELELTFSEDEREVSWIGMPQWTPPNFLGEPNESRRGKIESHKFKSTALDAEVELDVYLPAGYARSTEPLPVAYLHGGKQARGPLNVTTALDNLIGVQVAPIIAVFIHREPPFFNAESYARMCGEEIPQFIDSRYRTVRSREGRAHVAWGPGGYAGMYTALVHSDTAAKMGVQSPWMVLPLPIEPVMKNASDTPLTVYLDWGKYDIRAPLEFWSMSEMGRTIERYFRDHGYRPKGGESNDGSGAASWQNRLDDLFAALFPMPQK
jgi:outer membrane protein assembly factor BamB